MTASALNDCKSQKRTLQNRKAQQAYRERKAAQIGELVSRASLVEQHKASIEKLQKSNQEMQESIELLRQENEMLKSIIKGFAERILQNEMEEKEGKNRVEMEENKVEIVEKKKVEEMKKVEEKVNCTDDLLIVERENRRLSDLLFYPHLMTCNDEFETDENVAFHLRNNPNDLFGYSRVVDDLCDLLSSTCMEPS